MIQTFSVYTCKINSGLGVHYVHWTFQLFCITLWTVIGFYTSCHVTNNA